MPAYFNLPRWTRPDSYVGSEWPEYFVFLSQTRDSDALTRSNFTCALEALGGESSTVHVTRERHWAVGWVEWIAIHESNDEALKIASDINKRLDAYPVVDEDHFSQLEWDEAADYWTRLRLHDRIHYLSNAGLSIFAARRDYLPDDPTGALFESLRG